MLVVFLVFVVRRLQFGSQMIWRCVVVVVATRVWVVEVEEEVSIQREGIWEATSCPSGREYYFFRYSSIIYKVFGSS